MVLSGGVMYGDVRFGVARFGEVKWIIINISSQKNGS